MNFSNKIFIVIINVKVIMSFYQILVKHDFIIIDYKIIYLFFDPIKSNYEKLFYQYKLFSCHEL